MFNSQKGQDEWVINEILPNHKKGFFLDLAAADGVSNNNSFALEKAYEWGGICIEPNPAFFKKLKQVRACTVECCAISDKEEKVKFRIDNGQLGGIVAENTDNSYRIRGTALKSPQCQTIELRTRLLTDILSQNNAPKHIDYWSLDVEGSEEAIISTFDFAQYSFGCLTIERPTPKCNQILRDRGYIFVKNFLYDSFYIHPSINKDRRIKCDPFQQIPPKKW